MTFTEFLHLKVLWTRGDINDLFPQENEPDFFSRSALQCVHKDSFRNIESDLEATKGRDPHALIHSGKMAAGLFSVFEAYIPLIMSIDAQPGVDSSPKVINLGIVQPQPKASDTSGMARQLNRMTLQKTPMSSFGSPLTPETPELSLRAEYEALLDHATWVPDPKVFVLNDKKNSRRLLEARVDGYLRKRMGASAYGIVEVKPYVRTSHTDQIEWQEGAQMAAWISQTPGTVNNGVFMAPGGAGIMRRFMITQNRQEIYVTVAEYDKTYEEYLHGGPQTPPLPSKGPAPRAPMQIGKPPQAVPLAPRKGARAEYYGGGYDGSVNRPSGYGQGQSSKQPLVDPTPGFLLMRCFGPVPINDPRRMRKLCQAIVALSIEAVGACS
ncbi:hypothetical protein CMQ_8170 [Grosmannia clavigera kw1407]|uniref:Uncharacterized protein n=1 Tax=Grosmannia clavigera (strain kw1407 / UAMH 11150) TaxID=655863 RepID=F0XKT3_GROCL|nr:uncharacterized protein CMQ_8170 [Grosmannia clavigera kw1407]EFX01704.1 hypothetical protein CMQ_8170 [Grosmannia clavigera kw1407]